MLTVLNYSHSGAAQVESRCDGWEAHLQHLTVEASIRKTSGQSAASFFFFLKYFFGLLALLIEQLKTWTGNRMREEE